MRNWNWGAGPERKGDGEKKLWREQTRNKRTGEKGKCAVLQLREQQEGKKPEVKARDDHVTAAGRRGKTVRK